jgi:uncharacterized protein YutE (UPF0331/DUF86 family)
MTSAAGRPDSIAAAMRDFFQSDILVHGYEAVDLSIVRNFVETRLSDLLRFVEVIRKRLRSS